MRNIKRELFIFTASDIDAMEEHFEKMAMKGWMLEKTGEYIVRYRKTEPQELKFSIDIFPKLSSFDYPDKAEVVEYRNLCIDAGWDFVDSSQKFQVFSSPKGKSLPPIQTDDRIKQSIVNKSLIFELIILTICLGFFIRYAKDVFPLNYRSLHSNIILALMIIAPIMIIPTVVYIVSNLVWILKAKSAVKKELPLPKSSYKTLRIKTLLLLYPVIFFILSIVLGIILDLQKGNFMGLVSILPVTIGFTVGYIFKKNKNIKKRSKDYNIGLFILVLIITLVAVNMLIFKVAYIGQTKELKEGYKGLKLIDFNRPYPDVTEFSRGGSILLPKHSNYYEIYFGENGISIDTEYYEAKSNKIGKYIFNNMIKEYGERYTINSIDEIYDLFDEAYFIEERETLRLLTNKEVFVIRTSLDFEDEEIIRIITDKLYNGDL